jgi:hypothetical protein
MSSDVRINIEDDEPVLRAVKYEVRLVVLGIARNAAKNAARSLCVNARRDVFRTPGTPQSLQCGTSTCFET